jgi:hypothetical protein
MIIREPATRIKVADLEAYATELLGLAATAPVEFLPRDRPPWRTGH